ncbi:transglycosylase family protein [Mycolicibacterium sediminis]|uniref:transglycosylase family protein n=1 Tax=Mycolicibacterium sediminis TaxID=1286180 RepID=UPI003CCDF11B
MQFSPSTCPDTAVANTHRPRTTSKDEQIAVAERVLASQGRGAWPTCGRGLSSATPRNVVARRAAAARQPELNGSARAAVRAVLGAGTRASPRRPRPSCPAAAEAAALDAPLPRRPHPSCPAAARAAAVPLDAPCPSILRCPSIPR